MSDRNRTYTPATVFHKHLMLAYTSGVLRKDPVTGENPTWEQEVVAVACTRQTTMAADDPLLEFYQGLSTHLLTKCADGLSLELRKADTDNQHWSHYHGLRDDLSCRLEWFDAFLQTRQLEELERECEL